MDEVYGLTDKGAQTALGVVSALCHGYSLDQAAVLNGLADADAVKVILWLVCYHAGIAEGISVDDV